MRNTSLGHIDFNAFNGLNPYNSKCRASDLDMVFEWKNHFLIIEWKRPGEYLPTGQEMMLKAFSTLPQVTVFLVNGHTDEETEVQNIYFIDKTHHLVGNGLHHLKSLITQWHEHCGRK